MGRRPAIGRIRLATIGLVALLGSACAPGGGGSAPARVGEPEPGPRVASTKIITVEIPEPVKSFGVWNISTAGGAASIWELHSEGLVTTSDDGRPLTRLALGLPSLDDGSMVIFPDGRMQTTWKLRPGVKWQDGAPFTADDLVLGSEVIRDPELPGEKPPSGKYIEQIEARDAQTAVITWKASFYRANLLTLRELWPMPSHLLRNAFDADKQAFMNLPYWTTDYVHLGPFRLTDFGLGETLTFERFDDYFLGRPKVDRVTLQTIRDPNAILASLQARAIDMTTELSVSPDIGARLRDEWARSGEGSVFQRQGAWRYLKVQFDPELGRPAELSKDVHVRRGLMFGLDRAAIQDAVFPGFKGTESDTFLLNSDPRGAAVGKPFSSFPYDPTRAAAELEEAGWRRGADGRMLNTAGQAVQIPIRSTAAFVTEMAIAAARWRELGLEVQEETSPPGENAEGRAKYPGFVSIARGTGDGVLTNFDSRNIPKASNRYTGQNVGGYANPAMDRLIDTLSTTIDQQEQARILASVANIFATDLPALPIYFRIEMVAQLRSVRALETSYAAADSGTIAHNAYLWDRD